MQWIKNKPSGLHWGTFCVYVNIQPPHVTEQCVKGLLKADICGGTQGGIQMRAHSAAPGYSPGEGMWQNADKASIYLTWGGHKGDMDNCPCVCKEAPSMWVLGEALWTGSTCKWSNRLHSGRNFYEILVLSPPEVLLQLNW